MFACSGVDGGEGAVDDGVFIFWAGGGRRDEFLSGEDVCVCDVADVGEVEQVGVVSDLVVCSAFFERFGISRYELVVPGSRRTNQPKTARGL